MVNDFDWTIENGVKFQKSLEKLGTLTEDFRIPFRLIASDFYRSQRQLFSLKSAGLYATLGGKNPQSKSGFGSQTKEQRAKDLKERRTGHAWAPILYGKTGNLRDSTLSPNHKNSIFILLRQELEIGTNVQYGPWLQEGTKFMEKRKFVFIDGGRGDKSKGSGINGRRERWKSIVQDHIKQLVTKRIL